MNRLFLGTRIVSSTEAVSSEEEDTSALIGGVRSYKFVNANNSSYTIVPIPRQDGLIDYDIYLYGVMYSFSGPDIRQISDLRNILELSNASINIRILISSPGGHLQSALMLMSSIKKSAANITTHAIGMCGSAATAVWGSVPVDKRYVNESSVFSFHLATDCAYDNSRINADRSLSLTDYVETNLILPFKNEGILSEQEYDAVCRHGRDIYVSGRTVLSRLGRS